MSDSRDEFSVPYTNGMRAKRGRLKRRLQGRSAAGTDPNRSPDQIKVRLRAKDESCPTPPEVIEILQED